MFHGFMANMRLGFKVALVYRFHFVVTLLTAPINLVIYYFLWKSIYEFSKVTLINGYTFKALIGYYVLNMIVAFFTWSEADKWMEQDIIRGNLVMKLIQPMKHIINQISFESGLNLLAIMVEAIPILAVGIIFFGLTMAEPLNFFMFLISLLLATIMYFLFSYLLGLMAFWLKRIHGLIRLKKPVIALFSGGLLPLVFFPVWFQNISTYLPFQYVRAVPINIYLGVYPVSKTLLLILGQLIWIGVLFALALFIWKKAVKKFTGVGA